MTVSLRVLIVDDEPLARARLRDMLSNIPDIDIAGEATNGSEGLAQVEALQPDLVFLDINMPGLDGLRMLEALDDPPAVVFSTAAEHHAVKAFDLEAVDYLLKPYSKARLARAVERARRLLSPGEVPAEVRRGEPVRIAAENGLATEFVPTTEIRLLEIVEGVVFLHRSDGESLTCGEPLNDIEGLLPPDAFFRVSRQAIVNLHTIEAWQPNSEGGLDVRLQGGRTIQVSRRRARHLKGRSGERG